MTPGFRFKDGKLYAFSEVSVISKRRQRDIAEALGFPGTESSAKMGWIDEEGRMDQSWK
ncbi:MAG: hypothetical protein ACOYM3_35345 [Terrimicrobiaceae bacterium]